MLSANLNLSTLSKIFADETDEKARVFVESLLWPNGTVCPHCGVIGTAYLMTVKGKQTPNQKLNNTPAPSRTLYKCKDCRKPFTVRVGTIFEDSHIALRHWVMTFHLMTSSKKGVSSHQIAREVGVTVKSAWFMTHRIREAMTDDPTDTTLDGIVEVDETYVGGKPRPGDGKNHKRGRGTKKTPVMVLVERGGEGIHCKPLERVDGKTLTSEVKATVAAHATVMTDDFAGYNKLQRMHSGQHHTINHSEGEYSRITDEGLHVTTNTAESFFALLKRGHYGIFHHLSKHHLHRYCNEFGYRWTFRKVTDGERMVEAIKGAAGKRLYYQQPIRM